MLATAGWYSAISSDRASRISGTPTTPAPCITSRSDRRSQATAEMSLARAKKLYSFGYRGVEQELGAMKTARVASTVIVVCLACTLSLSDAPEPGSYASHLQDSVDFYESGDCARSVRAAEEALELLDEKSAVAYNNICIARMRLQEYEQAAAACNKALRLAPGYRRAWNNLGWVYEKVVEQTPTAGAYLDLSVVRYWQGQLDQSVAAARQALELDPNNAIAHNNICAALAKDGKWKRAIRECETALTIDPEYERAKNNLQWARSGKID